jgi:hypothetical protein
MNVERTIRTREAIISELELAKQLWTIAPSRALAKAINDLEDELEYVERRIETAVNVANCERRAEHDWNRFTNPKSISDVVEAPVSTFLHKMDALLTGVFF